jgi:hypothetical protein
MIAKRLTFAAIAAGLAFSSVASSAAAPLSIARIGASLSQPSYFQDEDDDDDGGSTAVILGVVLVVLVGIAAISGDGGSDNPNSP